MTVPSFSCIQSPVKVIPLYIFGTMCTVVTPPSKILGEEVVSFVLLFLFFIFDFN